jgi:hypothetical protein
VAVAASVFLIAAEVDFLEVMPSSTGEGLGTRVLKGRQLILGVFLGHTLQLHPSAALWEDAAHNSR